jgi:hypothetical protein
MLEATFLHITIERRQIARRSGLEADQFAGVVRGRSTVDWERNMQVSRGIPLNTKRKLVSVTISR